MQNGEYRYRITMHAPLGLRLGELQCLVDGPTVHGLLTLFGAVCPFHGSVEAEDTVRFDGEMKTLLHRVAYQAEGTLDEKEVSLQLRTAKGAFALHGEAVKK